MRIRFLTQLYGIDRNTLRFIKGLFKIFDRLWSLLLLRHRLPSLERHIADSHCRVDFSLLESGRGAMADVDHPSFFSWQARSQQPLCP
jgi:hypothetical protein